MIGVRVRLEHLQAGWAVIVLEGHDSEARIDASYVGGRDSLEELAHLGVSAKRVAPMEVWFEGEPSQCRLALEPAEQAQVDVTVHWFRDHVRRQPKELGEPTFAARCAGHHLAREIRNMFSAWKDKQADYQARWYHPFPARAFG
ncbi:MAG: hypothetical protein ACREUF_19255, partial [Solimonas sp.]